ncbi:MAG: hypothetical protein LBS65_05495 [Desulfovibrio sp.]|jgi:hypothetical protein|nr:hypothetical protein [Desulfovibrio sp.]
MSQVACESDKIVGIETEIIIHPLTAIEFRVMGMNNAQLPGFNTETITDDSFDKKIAGRLPGSMSYTDTSFTAYMIRKDPAQEELRMLAHARSRFSDFWYLYTEKTRDFWALDLIADPCGVVSIAGFAPQAYGRNDLVQVQFALTVNGESGFFEYHTESLEYDVASGVLTVDTPPSGFSFITLGFKPKMTVIVETGTAASPYFYAKIADAGVTADELTFTDTSISKTGLSGLIHAARVEL